VRIFHLVPNLNYGGLQEVVRALALHQRRRGHCVTIGCWTNASNHREGEWELEGGGVFVLYLRRAADGTLSHGRMSLLRHLKTQLDASKPDILHIHNPFNYYAYGVVAARAAARAKIVDTLHATAMLDHPGFGRKARFKFWAAAMLSDGLVSVSEECEAVLRAKYALPGKKLFVVENGIDVARFLAVPARSARGEVIFGAVGRMSPEKNHRILIESFALVRRNHNNVRLRFLGSGPLEPGLRELVRNLGLEHVVTFCGFSHDVAGFLSGLDVFALSSDSEGLPLSLLEAIASGLPVVATEVGAVPRIVQDTGTGWLCAPQNTRALVKAMESAISCSDRRERGERGRHVVAAQYSAERMTRDYDRLYQNLLQ
jgi:glycosyltransferase involved in cell wall biosynthesis